MRNLGKLPIGMISVPSNVKPAWKSPYPTSCALLKRSDPNLQTRCYRNFDPPPFAGRTWQQCRTTTALQKQQTRAFISRVDFQTSLQPSFDLAVEHATKTLGDQELQVTHPSKLTPPTQGDIDDFRDILLRKYNKKDDALFRISCNDIFRALNHQNCNGVIIDGSIKKGSNLAVAGHASMLLWTSLIKNLGFNPIYAQDNRLSFAFAKPDDSSEISGHQDLMLIPTKSHLAPSKYQLIPNMMLIGAYSGSNMETWVVESEKIFEELKKLGLFDILTKQKFMALNKMPGEERSRINEVILIKKDENGSYYFDGFDTRKDYFPTTSDPETKKKAEAAIKFIKDILARDAYRQSWTFNDNMTQAVFFSNRDCVHGRNAELLPSQGPRWMLVVPCDKKTRLKSVTNASAAPLKQPNHQDVNRSPMP